MPYRGEEEMNMESGELARGMSERLRLRDKPLLPLRVNQVMPNVRRVADEQRPTLDRRQLGTSVVLKQNTRAASETDRREVRPRDERRQRINLYTDEHCLRELRAGRN